MPQDYKRQWFLSVLAAAAGVCLVALPGQLLRVSGYDLLTRQAEAVVDDVTAQNLAAFVAVSAVKTALAIIEDSSVGVGFQLEVGDAVQAVYDYVDFVWEALMYSLLVLGTYKILLETHLLHLGLQLMGLGLLCWSFGAVSQRVGAPVRRVAIRAVFAGALAAYIVPAALVAMHYVAEHYTAPVKQKQGERIQKLDQEIRQLRAQIWNLKQEVDLLRPVESLGAVRERMGEITASAVATVGASTQAMLYYVVIVLFELLVFPMLSAYLLFKLLHALFGRALGQGPPVSGVPARV